jgi:DNA-binding transcriptional LysR family regulator
MPCHAGWVADVELRQLRYLVAVAEQGGFTTAAKSLTMTQPALSRAVATLERVVGVPLLDRTSRGVVLTVAGKVLVDQARDIIGQMESAVRQARVAGHAPAPLRISSRGCDLVALHQLVHGYRGLHPGEHAESVEADWQTQLDDVRAGAAQIALVSGEFEPEGFDSAVLTSHDRVALVATSHRLADRRVVNRAELLPDPVVTWTGNTPAERSYWLGTTEDQESAVVAGPQVNDAQKLLAYVRLGAAIAFLPRHHLDHGERPKDVVALQVEGMTPARVRLVWAEHETSMQVARFVRYATAAYAAA